MDDGEVPEIYVPEVTVMASIEKRGDTYRIRVFVGYDANGKKLTKSRTWKPDAGMTKRQIERELEKQKVIFEDQILKGQFVDGEVKFEAFARYRIEQLEKEGKMKPLSIKRLKDCQDRVYAAIGHLKIGKITSVHIQEFINNLAEEGIRDDNKFKTKVDLKQIIKQRCQSQDAFAIESGVAIDTLRSAIRGNNVTWTTAAKISSVLDLPVKDVFTEQPNPKSVLATKTQKNYLGFLSGVFRYAMSCNMIEKNPCKGVHVIVTETKERDVYTLDEAREFFDRLSKAPLKYQAFFTLAAYGGFRRGEILGLEWSDINFDEYMISINRTSLYTKEKGVFTSTPKTKSSMRTLKLSEHIFDLLRELKAEQAKQRFAVGDRWNENDRLFIQWDGSPMGPDTVRHWLRKFCDEEGLRYVSIHSFRHLNASLLISNGADVKTVSSALGHAQTTTTMNIYAHSFAEVQALASKALADSLDLKPADHKKKA